MTRCFNPKAKAKPNALKVFAQHRLQASLLLFSVACETSLLGQKQIHVYLPRRQVSCRNIWLRVAFSTSTLIYGVPCLACTDATVTKVGGKRVDERDRSLYYISEDVFQTK